MIAGVCAAFAQRYHWDVTVVRIITALVCLSGAGALAYLIAWIIIPEEPYAMPTNIV
jgi:phage shock protein PspC (stress-responsive transcriptional regulator)